MSVSLFAVPAEIQAVFDSLRAVLATNPDLINCNSYATVDAHGNNVGITVIDKYQSSASFTQRTQTGQVFLAPMSATAAAGETVQFTATTLDATGSPVPATVTWTLQAGALGTIAGGLYTAPPTLGSAAVDYVTAQDTTGNSATASVQLHL